MKTVAVSQRVETLSDRKEIRDSVDQKLIGFFLTAGYFVVPVPNIFTLKNSENENLDLWLKKFAPQAIVLSGGNNIGQYESRDLTEYNLLEYAFRKKLPLLGICRGMQMIAKWSGTDLHNVDNHVGIRHNLKGEIKHQVNSFHDFSLTECPKNFKILARSEDGEIEAICHDHLPWEGWMWHPEREEYFSKFDIERVKKLFN